MTKFFIGFLTAVLLELFLFSEGRMTWVKKDEYVAAREGIEKSTFVCKTVVHKSAEDLLLYIEARSFDDKYRGGAVVWVENIYRPKFTEKYSWGYVLDEVSGKYMQDTNLQAARSCLKERTKRTTA